MRFPCVLLLAAAAILPAAYAQSKDADWPTYTRDLAGTRYSPLTQIGTGNVSKLAPAWTYRLRPAAPPTSEPPAEPAGAAEADAADQVAPPPPTRKLRPSSSTA